MRATQAASLLVLLIVGFVSSSRAEDAPNPSAALELGSRRELFVDRFLIASLQGVELKMHTPLAQEVVLTSDAPWEGNISAYYTLFQDGNRYRMYYRGAHFDEVARKPTHPEVACYAESPDGIRWEKPKLGLIDYKGSKENNIVWSGPGSHNFTPFKDDNPRAADNSRYKALAGDGKGLIAYQSADGLRWSPMQAKPVITRGAFDSQNLAFWDAARKEYRAYWRFFNKTSGHRSIRTARSSDFIHWQDEADLHYGDTPSEHLYTNAIRPYPRAPHLYVGFPTRFQPKTQQVEPVFMSSRDGVNFQRWTEPLIPITAPKDRDGNRSNYMTSGLLELPGKPNELSVYATEAYYAGPASRVRRFTFRTDGFVSLHAGQAGTVVTRPLRFTGKELHVNYQAGNGGHVQVEIQDAAGKPIPDFTLADCQKMSGDAIDQAVRWSRGTDVGALAGLTVQLKIVLTNADMYAIQFAN